MKRKVIRQGHNTLTITLPSKWCEQNCVKAGDELQLETANGVLRIMNDCPREEAGVVIKIDRFGSLIPRTIHAMYKKGVDNVRIEYEDSKHSSLIQKAIREETLGYEIVKQTSKYCEIKCISNPVLNEFDSILRRTFLLLNTMANDSIEAIGKGDFDSLENIKFMELTNNRYVTVCRRILNKFGHPDYPNTNFIYYLIEELERLADHYKYMCAYLLENPIKVSKKTLDFYEKVNDVVKDLHNLFYDFKPELAESISKRRKALVKQSFKLFNEVDRKELNLIHNLSIIFQKTFCLVGPIIAMKV
jgi:phosphate uptake regulator